jgi:hypothetical protein
MTHALLKHSSTVFTIAIVLGTVSIKGYGRIFSPESRVRLVSNDVVFGLSSRQEVRIRKCGLCPSENRWMKIFDNCCVSSTLKAFAEVPKVLEIGEAGMVIDTFEHPGFNSLTLSALEDDQAEQVFAGLKTFS